MIFIECSRLLICAPVLPNALVPKPLLIAGYVFFKPIWYFLDDRPVHVWVGWHYPEGLEIKESTKVWNTWVDSHVVVVVGVSDEEVVRLVEVWRVLQECDEALACCPVADKWLPLNKWWPKEGPDVSSIFNLGISINSVISVYLLTTSWESLRWDAPIIVLLIPIFNSSWSIYVLHSIKGRASSKPKSSLDHLDRGHNKKT